uniref:Transposase (Putative), gypsy type n=1 Tax=Tanacetum cinerariifolium TaxID=118510 RepID=A0A6L2JSU7_TANCI|nr:hypothetical protein [Tanacetum cinerariifolium]
MDLISFIRTADPTKVRVAERQRVEDEPRLLETTVGRAVPLPPVAPARAFSELEASIDKLFDEGFSGDGQGIDVQPVIATTDTIVEDVDPLQPRHQRKRKIVVADASRPSHPPKKLKEDYRALGGAFTAEREDKSPADFVTELNLRTIGAPQRFVISSDSSHHSGANIAEAEVDSIIRTDFVLGGFFDVSGSDFLIGGIRTIFEPDSDLQKVYISQWSITNGFGLDNSRICHEMLVEFAPPKFFASVHGMDHDKLFTEFNVGAARQISLNAEVRMRDEYNIREKKRLRFFVDEQAELLKVRDGDIENLKAQLLLEEAGAAKAICLQAEVFKFEAIEKSLQASVKVREQEVADLDAQVTAVKLQNDNLVDQISSAGLQEKVAAYEDFIGQLEKFQDEKMDEVNEKFDKLCADFVDMALHLEEKFYLHILTTISGRRWLLTHSMELAIVRCLNSTEYLSALGAAISKAVEKGMQEGLSAGITHGAEGRKLADVAAYNPSAKANYLSALQRLQNPHANQLMVPIHHSSNQHVIGASALSLSLDVSHSRIRKIRENIASHVSVLHGVFVPLSEPLSDAALEGTKGTSGSAHDTTTTLSVTFVFVGTIPPISTDDYEVAHADGQEGASVDGETAAVKNINPFSDVSNAEFNILE